MCIRDRDTTINNLPAGIVVKEINNDFRYVYRNRESYNRDHFSDNPVGKNDYDFYPPIVAEKKRQEDIEVAATGKGLHWIAEGKDRNGNLIILDKRKIKVDGDELSSPIIVSIEWDITELEIQEVCEALRSGWITTGPRTKQLEKELAEYCHVAKLVCLNSATAAEEMNLCLLYTSPSPRD